MAVLDDENQLVDRRVPTARAGRDRIKVLVDHAHQLRTRRRRAETCGTKHAFASRGFCEAGRQVDLGEKPQVTSSDGPASVRRSAGSTSFYDPTTGQFLSRDPLTAITLEPYGYVAADPLNVTDPSGLFGWDDVAKIGVAVAVGVVVAVAVTLAAPAVVVVGGVVLATGSGLAVGAGLVAGYGTYAALNASNITIPSKWDLFHEAKASRSSGKEKANDIPSWVDKGKAGQLEGETLDHAVERAYQEAGKSCPGKGDRGAKSEWSQIKKYISRKGK